MREGEDEDEVLAGFQRAEVCWPLARRRMSEALLALLAGAGEFVLTRGRSMLFSMSWSSLDTRM